MKKEQITKPRLSHKNDAMGVNGQRKQQAQLDIKKKKN